jgi:hypothetical protein
MPNTPAQARTSPTQQGPSTAERVRTACARANHAVLAVAGCEPATISFHHLRNNGTVIIAAPQDCAATALAWQAGNAGLPAVLELTDQSPLHLREPVRALVWLRGTLTPVPTELLRAVATEVAAERPDPVLLDVGHHLTLLRLNLDSAVVADTTGAEPVDRLPLLACSPDPFWNHEQQWLAHLDSAHSNMLDLIAQRLPAALRGGRVRPLALDRFGITLRIEGEDGDKDARLDFAAPVRDTVELSRALRVLVGCPFLNGLRARQQ